MSMLVADDNVESIRAHADFAHAPQLREYCDWMLRQKSWEVPDERSK
jgi:hypothetical protein